MGADGANAAENKGGFFFFDPDVSGDPLNVIASTAEG
jgi:hypothetical protein